MPERIWATVANGVSQITFTYAQPDSGSFSLQLLAGYGLSRVLIGPSSADIANGTTGFYTFGTGATQLLRLQGQRLQKTRKF